VTHEDRLAHLVIFMAALVVWALSGKDGDLYREVKEQGEMEWARLVGKA
jgi:hypothetical protein